MKKVLFILLSSLILLSSCNLDGQGIFNDILSSEPVTNEKVQEFIGVLDNKIYVNSENGLSYYKMNASAQNTTLHTPNEKEQYAFYKFVFKSGDKNYALKFINDSSDYHYEVENIDDHTSKRVTFKAAENEITNIIDLNVYYVEGKNVLTAIVKAGEKYYLINTDSFTYTDAESESTLTVADATEIKDYKNAKIIGPNAYVNYANEGEKYFVGDADKSIKDDKGNSLPIYFLSSDYAVAGSERTVYKSSGDSYDVLKNGENNITFSGTPFYTKAGGKTFLISSSALITDGINNEVKTLFSSLSGSTKQYIAVQETDSIKVYRVTASNGVYCTTVDLSASQN